MVAPMALNSARHASSLPSLSSLISSFRHVSLQPKRLFTSAAHTRLTKKLPSDIPPYPYGPNHTFKQSNNGLYGGASIMYGNKVSKGRNKGKTRRVWKPNVRRERIYSNAMGQELKLEVTHRVLRTINKVGGLDQYLLGDKPARIKELGVFGWVLRWKVMKSGAMRKRFNLERQKLGLANPETFEEFLARHTEEQKIQAAVEDQSQQQQQKKPQPTSSIKAPANVVSETPSPNVNTV